MTIDDLLTAEELAKIRASVATGHIDQLDAGALLDHIDAITASYESLVMRTAEHNNQAQVRMSELEVRVLEAEELNAKQEQ